MASWLQCHSVRLNLGALSPSRTDQSSQRRITGREEDRYLDQTTLAARQNGFYWHSVVCADRFSRQFLTAMPLRETDSVFCNAEWDEAIACYMGLVSPACKGHAARGVVLDVTGAPALDPS